MKTKIIIEEITHDDLANLFSTATYGSDYLTCKIPNGNYKGTELEDKKDCVEDKWAKVLLAGKELYVFCYNSMDVRCGKLPYKWIVKEQASRYTITLKDIKEAAQKLLDTGSEYDKSCMHDWMFDSNVFDSIEADRLMQLFVLGEVVFG